MRFLIDINALSELAKRRPDAGVVRWFRERSPLDLAISVLTLGEIEKGVALLQTGRRRQELEEWLGNDLPRQFIGRVLPIDDAVSRQWGRLAAEGVRTGRPLPVIDGLLLATAAVNKLAFVTRNQTDCDNRGVPTIDPWAA